MRDTNGLASAKQPVKIMPKSKLCLAKSFIVILIGKLNVSCQL